MKKIAGVKTTLLLGLLCLTGLSCWNDLEDFGDRMSYRAAAYTRIIFAGGQVCVWRYRNCTAKNPGLRGHSKLCSLMPDLIGRY
jgi:hypothetical protein